MNRSTVIRSPFVREYHTCRCIETALETRPLSQRTPVRKHRAPACALRFTGGLLEVGANGNGWGSAARPRSAQESCSRAVTGAMRTRGRQPAIAGARQERRRREALAEVICLICSPPMADTTSLSERGGRTGIPLPVRDGRPDRAAPRPPRPLRPIPVRGGALRRPRGSLEAADRSP